MIGDVSIVVLTPVKNEDWILETFLMATSLFADYILVADQLSTDKTKEIILKFPKAIYIENNNLEYDEEFRQRLLIEKARALVPGKKLLLAIDADEIISADSVDSQEWKMLSECSPGTQIWFKKPDALPEMNKVYDYSDYFLLGYIDDGKLHSGTKFHSPRLPDSNKKYKAKSIRFIHLALVRELEYNARQRLYMVLENINQSDPLRLRLRKYSRRIQRFLRQDVIKTIPVKWRAYADAGIDLSSLKTSDINGFNFQILEKLDEFGCRRFWMEDIWYVDYTIINNMMGGVCSRKIKRPPFYIDIIRATYIEIYCVLLFFKNVLRK